MTALCWCQVHVRLPLETVTFEGMIGIVSQGQPRVFLPLNATIEVGPF